MVLGLVACCRYIASDCDAVAIMRDAQRYTQTPEDAVAVALKAGTCWLVMTMVNSSLSPIAFT